MADKKIEKALYGPSLTEVALGALLGLLAGVLMASGYLVFKPVEVIKAPPEEPSISTVYYQAGSESSAKSRGWQAKQQKFVAGQPIVVVEDELNAWAASMRKPSAPKKEGQEAPAAEGILIPDVPNFRFVENKLQIGLKCTLNWYGLARDVTVQAVGDFRKSGSEFVFVPDKIYLGSCPVHLIPGVSGLLVSQLITRSNIPDEIRAAWAQLGAVSIEGDTLTLAGQ